MTRVFLLTTSASGLTGVVAADILRNLTGGDARTHFET